MKISLFNITLSILLVVVYTFRLSGEGDHSVKEQPVKHTPSLGSPTETVLNANTVSSWYSSDGIQEQNIATGNSGLTFPRQTATSMFSAGLLWGGLFMDGLMPPIRVNGTSYNSGIQRGAIQGIRTGIAEDPDAPDVRIWRVRRDYNTADLTLDAAEVHNVPPEDVTPEQIQFVLDQYITDWLEWPAHKGAPFYDSDVDGIYSPEMNGSDPVLYPEADEPGLANADQIIWYVANDLTAQPWTNVQSGIEIQTTIWGYDRTDGLGKTILKRFRLIYKGTATTSPDGRIEDMYVGQWADADVGSASNDFAACDSARGLGYEYNAVPVDADYSTFGLSPPAIGNDIIQGPVVMTGNPADTAIFDFRKVSSATNLKASSFLKLEPVSFAEEPPFSSDGGVQWYQILRGLPPTPQGPPDPPPIVNPVTGQPTLFWLSGDPVAMTGWRDGLWDGPGDKRYIISSGPFDMAIGDTQETISATILGLGSNNLSSVTVLKANDDFVQEWFNSLVGWSFPTSIKAVQEEVPNQFSLAQNYPNPFNPVTTISYDIPTRSQVLVRVYNLLGEELATLVNGAQDAGHRTVNWSAASFPSGIYFYRIQAQSIVTGEAFTATGKMSLVR